MTELLKTIRERKSVRTFDGRPVSAEDREKIEQYIRTIENPFGVPVRFVLLDAGTHGLSSPVLRSASLLRSWCFTPGHWESVRPGSAAQ